MPAISSMPRQDGRVCYDTVCGLGVPAGRGAHPPGASSTHWICAFGGISARSSARPRQPRFRAYWSSGSGSRCCSGCPPLGPAAAPLCSRPWRLKCASRCHFAVTVFLLTIHDGFLIADRYRELLARRLGRTLRRRRGLGCTSNEQRNSRETDAMLYRSHWTPLFCAIVSA
jgi:hypothetical protein